MITIAFGIASLVLSILGLLIPVFGIFITGISGFLALLSAGRGAALGAAAVILNFINLILLSPAYVAIMSLEASHPSPEQPKLSMIWLIVLFIQIAAVGVFIVTYAIDKFDLRPHFKERIRGKQYPKNSGKIESSIAKEQNQQNLYSHATENRHEKSPGLLTKTIIYKLHGSKRPGSNFWKSEFDGEESNVEKIVADGSEFSQTSLARKRVGIALFSILAFCIIFTIPAALLHPNWFPFFRYSGKNSSVQINIKPQPPIVEKSKTGIQTSNSSSDRTFTSAQIAKAMKQVLEEKSQEKNPSSTEPTNPSVNNVWYIVELNNGETIITQSATESNEVITAFKDDGVIKRFKKEDVKSIDKVEL